MKPKDEKIQTFPCDYLLKVMGLATDEFEQAVVMIMHKHIPDLGEGAISITPSKGKNYISINVKFNATSQKQLDAIYKELSKNKHVLMAL